MKRGLALFFTALIGCATARPRVHTEQPTSPPWTESDLASTWRDFRQNYPFHLQTVAITAPRDGWRVLILSEPPPELTIEDIREATREVLRDLQAKKHSIGYGGWATDLVALVREEDLQRAIEDVHVLFYDTSYKAYALELPRPARVAARSELDLDVTAAELYAWILEQRVSFIDVVDRSLQDALEIRANLRPAVYLGLDHPLVAWWIPAGVDLADCRAQARIFALDSDLVIGALGSREGLLLVARERQVPIDRLPPLRFETLRLLASVRTVHLAQSYERNHVFAGRLRPKEDWAPIMLSPELIDTEYGSLLNITDQLLKSWSNKGLTRYENFPYRDPEQWPFPAPLIHVLGAKTLTYNWNTRSNAHFLERADGVTVMGFSSTGSLPVTYVPEGSPASANILQSEDVAYRYFAGLSDPNLVRVAQYASLYQIFTQFHPLASASGPVPANTPLALRRRLLGEVLGEIRSSTPEQTATLLEAVAKHAAQIGLVHYMPELERRTRQAIDASMAANGHQGTPEAKKFGELLLDTARTKFIDTMRKEERAQLEKDHAALKQTLAPLDSTAFNTFVVALDSPDAKNNSNKERWQPLVQKISAYQGVHDRYAKAAAETARSWIHTPVVVLSRNEGQIDLAEGGHNLDGKSFGVRVTARAPKGKLSLIESDGQPVPVVHPADAPRLPALTRALTRNLGSAEKMAAALQSEFARPVPKVRVALGDTLHANARPPTGRGFEVLNPSAAKETGIRSLGWSLKEASPATAANEIRVESRADGSFTVHRGGAPEEIPSYRALADRLHLAGHQASGPVEVVWTGVDRHKAAGLETTLRIRGAGQPDRAPIFVTAYVEKAPAKANDASVTLSADSVKTVGATPNQVTLEVASPGQKPATINVTLGKGEISPAEAQQIEGAVRGVIRENEQVKPIELHQKLKEKLRKLDRKYMHDELFRLEGRDVYIGVVEQRDHDLAA